MPTEVVSAMVISIDFAEEVKVSLMITVCLLDVRCQMIAVVFLADARAAHPAT